MEKATVSNTLYQVISAIFCAIVVISNVISSKMLQLPIFNDLAIPAGLITYPLTFLLSDLTTEIFGAAKAKLMVYTSLGTAILSFGIIQIALVLPSIDPHNQLAFQEVLGLNGVIILASLTGYVFSQIIDIKLYARIKQWSGNRHLWLRNNASTLISQIVDTILVNMIFLYWGLGMKLESVFQVMIFAYFYKAAFSLAGTPLFYLLIFLVKARIPFSIEKNYTLHRV